MIQYGALDLEVAHNVDVVRHKKLLRTLANWAALEQDAVLTDDSPVWKRDPQTGVQTGIYKVLYEPKEPATLPKPDHVLRDPDTGDVS